MSLSKQAIADDTVGLLEGLCTTRAIRRYTGELIPEQALRDILFAATRGPSGSNRQPFRFVVLTGGDQAQAAKALIARSAQRIWHEKRKRDRYDRGSGRISDSPKSRMANTMQEYVDNFAAVPCLILPCLIRRGDANPMEGASIYPAVQNLLLAARGLGYGGVITGFHGFVEAELKEMLGIPETVFIGGTLTLGKPRGRHGPVRRRPMSELVYADRWGHSPDWAADPPGTRHTRAGPPEEIIEPRQARA